MKGAHWNRWNASVEEFGGVTDNELETLADGTTPFLREGLRSAAFALQVYKLRTGNAMPWRQLLEAYRADELVQEEIEVIDQQGIRRNQIVFIDRGHGLKNIDELMLISIRNFSTALEAIENFRPGDHDSKLVRTHIGTVNAGLYGGHDQKEKAKGRIRAEYIDAKRGTGKKIKNQICTDCDISERTFDNYVSEVKKEIYRNRALRK